MASEILTTALLGLDDSGRRLLRAAAATGCFQILAVADQDREKAEKTATEFRCEAYSDYRRLVVQNQFDCLLVAAPPYTCDEHVRAALRKKFHVLRLAPPARRFEECLEYVRIAESENVRFAVANPSRFRTAYRTARELLAQGRVGRVILIAATVRLGAADRPAWQTDPGRAGGGVLLHEGYPLVDQLLWNFPPPQQVYALLTNAATDKQQRVYLTEDTAVVCMRFGDTSLANLVIVRHPEAEADTVSLEIHGHEARLAVTGDEVTLVTRDGRDRQVWPCAEDEQVTLERVLSSFARSLRAPEEHPLLSSGAENLRTMAVLEAAYLSARTGFPEEPARILQLAGGPPVGATSI